MKTFFLKRYFCALVGCLLLLNAKADHISGSELVYEYLGPGSSPNSQKIFFTYRLFRGCNSTSPSLNFEQVTLGIYRSGSRALYTQLALTYQTTINIALNTSRINCFSGNLSACYGVGIFTGIIELPITTDGYTASWIRCCRPSDIVNLPAGEIGISPIATIPGSAVIGNGSNNSASFQTNDTSLVCAGKNFRIDFSATDKDGDSLSYRFANGYNWIPQFAYNPPPLQVLDYSPLSYSNGYTATNPTGTSPVLNSKTGILTGIAPAAAGRYLFCVAVEEWRNGVKINEHIKEIPIAVGNCDFIEASLPQKIVNCSSTEVTFENEAMSSGIVNYRWTFDTSHPSGNVSLQPTPTHQYQDTGTYIAKLVVVGSTGCKDSAFTQVVIAPGLKAGFSLTGTCIRYPYLFTDTSSSKGGRVIKWSWDFGETSAANIRSFQNPSYLYNTAGSKTITLVVESEKGCKDTASYRLLVKDLPAIHLQFKDTSICQTDTLQLQETSAYANYQWTPVTFISNANTATPKVFPGFTQKYYVTVTTPDCDNTDSVMITVLPKNPVFAGRDTVICKGDPAYLNAITHASLILWNGDATLQNAGSASAIAFPTQTSQYIVTANPGKCATRDTVLVKTVPYPQVSLLPDTSICFGGKILLQASIQATFFSWNPTNSLSNAGTVSPYAIPSKSTQYVLTVWDTLGCSKTISDTIQVTVIPPFTISAGNDTAIVAGQTLQLQATVSDPAVQHFIWSPTVGLNNSAVSNPTVTLPPGIDSLQYRVTGYINGCYAEDVIMVKRFANGSDFYIPSAFTPNGDGLNDVFKIKSAGISRLEFMRIFNRYGQLIFHSTNAGIGWNGIYNGVQQPAGTYIFCVRGIDFTGNIIERKGTLVLLR